MNDQKSQTRLFYSATERAVAAALHEALPQHLELTPGSADVAVNTGEGFKFTPDFVIQDTKSGKTFPLEVKTRQSLSLSNELQLGAINSAYKRQGQDFVLLVISQDDKDAWKEKRLRNEGIQTIWAHGETDAARKLKEFLTSASIADT